MPYSNVGNSIATNLGSEPVGARITPSFRDKLEALIESTAESTANIAELLALVEAWPDLTAAVRAEILQLIG